MDESVAPEYTRFITAERRAERLSDAPAAMASGDVAEPVFISSQVANELVTVAAKRSVGLFHATKRSEVVWTSGDSELAISLDEVRLETSDGLIHVTIPVRCDQTGAEEIEVLFAVGADSQPAGMYASTTRLPRGNPIIVQVWGESLVAHAWQCVLGMISGIAGAAGKDERGNVLVPVELIANSDGLRVVPMARHRFSGSTGLASGRTTQGKQGTPR